MELNCSSEQYSNLHSPDIKIGLSFGHSVPSTFKKENNSNKINKATIFFEFIFIIGFLECRSFIYKDFINLMHVS